MASPDHKDASGSGVFNTSSVSIVEGIMLEVCEVFGAKDDFIDLPAGISKLDPMGFI